MNRPNVIIVMTDDQGYGDLSCHGNPVFQTPNLDQLHSESARFTDFHVSPMCTPTRGQLLTGLDAARNGAINVSSGRTLLRADLPTIADVFLENGYRTGIFGKWHLGDTYPYRPQDRGFEETLWFPSSHINSVPDVWDNDYFDDTYRRNGRLTKYEGYCTDVFFREAMDWISSVQTANGKQETKAPFLLYLPTNAPHSPYWLPVLKGDASLPEDRKLIINYSRMPFGFEFPSPDSPSIMTKNMAAVLWKRWRLLAGDQLYDLESDPLQRQNVIDRHPGIATAMRAHLDGWWEGVKAMANEPQAVVIGHEAENPVMLTACEWLDVFIDQQQQVRRADLKNSWWEIEVAEAGRYEFELRRWPREADLPLSAGLPEKTIRDGTLLPGKALPIAKARFKIGQQAMQQQRLAPGAKAAVFTANLKPGRTRLYSWFEDADRQAIVGAYYVYVKRD